MREFPSEICYPVKCGSERKDLLMMKREKQRRARERERGKDGLGIWCEKIMSSDVIGKCSLLESDVH